MVASLPSIPGVKSPPKNDKANPSRYESFERAVHQEWDEICQYVEDHGGSYGAWISENLLRRLTVNAPVTLGFVLLCILVHILTLGGNATYITRLLAVHDDWHGMSISQYTSFWTHCLVHADYQHLKGNMTLLLLVGPSVEYHFKSRKVLWIMTIVSLVSAMVHILVGKRNTHQLGASGVVFCFILLNSMVSAKQREIPVAFVVTMILYMGDELVKFIWPTDDISHHAHLSGGAVGAAAGFYLHGIMEQARQRKKSKSSTKTKGGGMSSWFGGGEDAKKKKQR